MGRGGYGVARMERPDNDYSVLAEVKVQQSKIATADRHTVLRKEFLSTSTEIDIPIASFLKFQFIEIDTGTEPIKYKRKKYCYQCQLINFILKK